MLSNQNAIIQFIILLGAIGTMFSAIALFFNNRDRIQNYSPGNFSGSMLFAAYSALLFFFLVGYVGYLTLWIIEGMQEPDFLISSILFFGAWFVVFTMVFIGRLFDSILVERKNQIDSLTGLLNKGASRSSIEEELGRPGDCALVIFDIDNFKELNDSLGHTEGDMALIKVADIIKTTLRESDIVGRFGGDEFVALLVNSSEEDAEQAILKVQRKVDEYFARAYPDINTGTSAGIAGRRNGELIGYDTLFRRADTAMYNSKENGKGRVTLWSKIAK